MLEMICADFLAGASVETEDSEALLFSLDRLFALLPEPMQQEFLSKSRDSVDDTNLKTTASAVEGRGIYRTASEHSRARRLAMPAMRWPVQSASSSYSASEPDWVMTPNQI